MQFAVLQESIAAFDILHFSSLPKHWAGDWKALLERTFGLLEDWCCSEGYRRFPLSF